MFYAIRMAGPTGFIIAFLSLVILALIVVKVVQLSKRSFAPGPAWESGLNAILFWGAFAAVLGFLGQCYGIYEAMKAIGQAGEFSPSVTAYGFFISFTSTMLGLSVLVVSAFCWWALRFWSRLVERSLPAT